MSEPRVVTRIADGVAIVTMQDAESSNAFTDGFVRDLKAALDVAVADPDARVILLRGLPEVFCSGAPIEMLRSLTDKSFQPNDIDLPRHLLLLPLPCIAAMRGHATGGGLALALCCDVQIAARQSRYGANFMQLGFTPGMGMTRLLEFAVSQSLAHEMLFTGAHYRGKFFDGGRGFNRVVDRNEVDDVAWDLALQMADKPRHALELLKRTLVARRRQLFELDHQTEALMHGICFGKDETRKYLEDRYD